MNSGEQVALVTAAGRGIGRGIAESLAEAGASLVINSYSESTVKETARLCEAKGARVEVCIGDITDRDKMIEMREQALSAFGKIDILINNVGGGSSAEITDKDNPLAEVEAVWDGTYAMSLKAPVLMCEAVMPHFIERKSGKIINMSSLAGRPGMPHVDLVPLSSSYHSAKAGLIRYTQLLADQVGRHNINVNAICPGIIYTDGWREISEAMVANHPDYKGEDPREWFLGVGQGRYADEGLPQTPLRREQTTADIAEAALFLTSDAAANITGQTLNVDGGMAKD